MKLLAAALVVTACFAGWPGPAGAEEYFGSAFEAGSLTADSTWQSILATPRIYVESPLVEFGQTFMVPELLCARGDALEPAGALLDHRGPVTAPQTYVLSVYRAPLGFRFNSALTYLFDKPWVVQPCSP